MTRHVKGKVKYPSITAYYWPLFNVKCTEYFNLTRSSDICICKKKNICVICNFSISFYKYEYLMTDF